ncbi:Di-sulfide bridge nucleocytoplasmic transport domain-containing protein [Chlamydoabsidia padenii]|nr:Di-sulfide bridge nucleocytoplasmic transport domain-containing protein [Chlamydoabsidia padenii]
MFNIDTHPSKWSASSLTLRYQQQLKARKQLNSACHTRSLTPSHSTPPSALSSSPAKHWPAATTLVPTWTDYLYHRSLSSTIMGYIQLICNIIILSTVGYILIQLIWTLQQDFQIKADEYTNALIQEIQSCAHQYKINMCHPETRVPALEKKCEAWLSCSNRGPSQVTKAKVSAETIAEIFNSFFDALSYKTMIFFTFMTVGYLIVSTFTFRFFKSRHHHPS